MIWEEMWPHKVDSRNAVIETVEVFLVSKRMIGQEYGYKEKGQGTSGLHYVEVGPISKSSGLVDREFIIWIGEYGDIEIIFEPSPDKPNQYTALYDYGRKVKSDPDVNFDTSRYGRYEFSFNKYEQFVRFFEEIVIGRLTA